jgi:hypothetical protein
MVPTSIKSMTVHTISFGKAGTKGYKVIHVNAENMTVRVGDSKLFVPAAHFYGSLDKGTARRVRKGLYAAGFIDIAAIVRDNTVGNAVKSRVIKMFPAPTRIAA